MPYVLWFEEGGKEALRLVGGKNGSLGELIKAGIPVPPGFSVTTEAYLEFIGGGIKGEIERILSDLDPQDVSSLERKSSQIRDLFSQTPLPERIVDEIGTNYKRLSEMFKVSDVPVAVRSSATAEDLPTASFAGQQDTFLWVHGIEDVLEKVKLCMASLFGPRAIAYRSKMGFPHEKVLISVGVQKMVNAKCAGVMFTLNPLNGDPSKVVIEGSWGLGETVVSGMVNPDKFVVDKVVYDIDERTISTKTVQCVYEPGKGVIHCEVSEDQKKSPCLEEKEIIELVKIAKKIENYYGCPQDIEWAIDRDTPFPSNIFILQSRPETVWSQKEKGPLLGKKTAYELLMEKALSPIRIGR